MENNEQIIELKRKLINGEINLEEYNRRFREYGTEESRDSEMEAENNGQEGADTALLEESAEETDEAGEAAHEDIAEQERPAHKQQRREISGACECPKKPYTLYALIGVLSLLLVISIFTNGFGFRGTGNVIADNPAIAVSGSAVGPLADPSIGPAGAKVTIVEYSDFECPFCQRAEATVKQALQEYEGKVRLVYRNFPLSFHNNAQAAAEAGELANEQGKFWEMHDKLFANRLNLKESDIKKYAEEIGLDMNRFNSGLGSGKYKAEVERDTADGKKLGVEGVPAFFINGKPLIGAQPIEEFRKLIDEELAK